MKRLFLLALLAATAPALRAQEVLPAPTELAQIDPAARDLLARTAARYQKFESFGSLIFWKIGAAGKGLEPRRFRVQMTIFGKFVVGEEFPDKSWRKAICDGKTLVEFNSKFPKIYTRRSVESPVYLGLAPQLEATLRSVGAEGPLISLMLTEYVGADVLSPNLTNLGIKEQGDLKIVSLRSAFPRDEGKTEAGAVQFSIEHATLTLDYVTVSEADREVFAESYAQSRFNPTFDSAMFRAVAPLNYKLIPYFPDEVSEVSTAATPPQVSIQ